MVALLHAMEPSGRPISGLGTTWLPTVCGIVSSATGGLCAPEGCDRVENLALPMEPGQFVDVVIHEQGSDEESVYFAKIKSAKDGVFLITQPQKDGEVMPHSGLPFPVTCRLPKEAHVWSFETEVTNIMGDTYVMTMPAEDAVVREARRSHVRAMVNLKVKAAVVLANRLYAHQEIEIMDLSGGGCQIMADRPFIANAILRVQIPLPQRVIEVHGRVVRANPFPQGTNKKFYTSGLAFTKIGEADREMMIKFIFEKMREDIKQGKLV